MPLSPELKPIIEEAASMPFFNTMPVEEARRAIAEMSAGDAGWSLPAPEPAEVEDRAIPGPSGDIPVRIYTPEGEGPFPLLMWFHGGGFVLGNLDQDDGACRKYCVDAGCVVVSVDYRLAPEHKFPAAPDDCLAATEWARGEGASSINVDPERVIIGGMSAGGNLAAVLSLMIRDRGLKPVKGQLLQVPVTDCAGDPETASYAEFATGYMLPAIEMYWFWDLYTARPEDKHHPYAAPLRAEDLSNLPPAFLMTAECDVLRDEGEAYAKRLREAGNDLTAKRYAGVNHLMCAFTAISETSRQAVQDQIDWLKATF